MSKKFSKPVAIALATGLVVALAAPMAGALEARDMKGNKVMIDEQTGFQYGGDNTGAYAGGKIGTGKKDPSVCGTFSGSTCSIKYVEK